MNRIAGEWRHACLLNEVHPRSLSESSAEDHAHGRRESLPSRNVFSFRTRPIDNRGIKQTRFRGTPWRPSQRMYPRASSLASTLARGCQRGRWSVYGGFRDHPGRVRRRRDTHVVLRGTYLLPSSVKDQITTNK